MKKAMILFMVCGGFLYAATPKTTTQESQLPQLLDATTDHTFMQCCEFINMPAQEVNSFATYYDAHTKRHRRIKSAANRQARAQRMRDKGRSALEVERPDLYAQLTALEAGSIVSVSPRACVAQNARLFLNRYGVWNEYKKSQAQSHGSVWAKVKGFARNGKQRVAQWFGNREPVTVAAN